MSTVNTISSVPSGLELGRAISRYGFSNIAAGFFILTSMVMMYMMVSEVKGSLEYQNEVSRKMLDYLEQQQHKHIQANRREATPEQLRLVAHMLYSLSQYHVLQECKRIAEGGRWASGSNMASRLQYLLGNDFQNQRMVLGHFTINSIPASDFLNPENISELEHMCLEQLSHPDGLAVLLLQSSLALAYERMEQEFLQKVLQAA